MRLLFQEEEEEDDDDDDDELGPYDVNNLYQWLTL